jgi:probable rRNA maturation factor
VRSILAARVPGVPRRRLSLLARSVLRGEGKNLDLRIIYAGDELVRRLNLRYRRLARTTDVLSFSVPGIPGVVSEAGEIYLSVPQARRQARRYSHALASELERLVVHGALHLAGFDHKRPAEARLMRAKERRYLKERS